MLKGSKLDKYRQNIRPIKFLKKIRYHKNVKFRQL